MAVDFCDEATGALSVLPDSADRATLVDLAEYTLGAAQLELVFVFLTGLARLHASGRSQPSVTAPLVAVARVRARSSRAPRPLHRPVAAG